MFRLIYPAEGKTNIHFPPRLGKLTNGYWYSIRIITNRVRKRQRKGSLDKKKRRQKRDEVRLD